MSAISIPRPVNPASAWRVLSWADWCERLSVSLVTARKRVHAMLDAGTLSRVAVCPACGRTAPGEQCVCGRRMGKGPSYAYALPGEPVPERIRVSVHRRKCRGFYTPVNKGVSELKTESIRYTSRVETQTGRPLSRNLDLSGHAGIVYALRRWGWHASQVLDARDDPARWELVTAWVRVVHRMGAKVRNPGAYVMRCVQSGKRPQWEPVSKSGGSPARQPARELTQEQRRQRYLEPVAALYRDDEAPASETGAGDVRDEAGLAVAADSNLREFVGYVLEYVQDFLPDGAHHRNNHQRDQSDQQRVLGEILPTLLANPRPNVVEPQHVIPPACCSPSIGAESLESVTESVRDWLEWGTNKSGSVFRRGLGPPTRSPRGRSSAGGRTLTLLPASIGPPRPAVNAFCNLTMVLEDYGGPAPPRYSDRGLTVRAA